MRAEVRTPSAISDEDARTRTRTLVTQSVKRQLVADVPLGCFLSGGIDSSIIAAAVKASVGKESAASVLTFSIAFDDPLYDESEHAADVAKHLGTSHRTFKVDFDAADDLPKSSPQSTANRSATSSAPADGHYLSRENHEST